MSQRVVLPRMPNLGRGYLGAIATLARPVPDARATLPDTELHIDEVHLEPERLGRYNELCGFRGEEVPITYPLVLTFPLQLALMTRADSALRLPGLVHLGVELRQLQPLSAHAVYGANCSVTAQAHTARGLEFTLAVVLTAAGEAVWRGESRILSRGRAAAKRPAARRPAGIEAGAALAEVQAPANIGRRYAQVSGDWNPIHLGRLGARALGFDRPIAHGMWTLAMMVAAAVDAPGAGGRRLGAEFLAPLRLPGHMTVHRRGTTLVAHERGTKRLVATAELEEIP